MVNRPSPPPDAARRLAAIVESSDDAIVSKDLNGIVTSWNRAAERLFGYTAEEMIGESIRRVIPDDRQGEEDDTLARIRRGDRVEHFETWRQRKDGRLVPISLTVSPIIGADGEVIGASKIARDNSDRIRIEAERAQLLLLAQDQVRITDRLNRVGAAVASSLDPQEVVQAVTDAAVELTGAEFGAFFYNESDPHTGGSYMLYALAGAPKSAFEKFPHPRATDLFGPTFRGEGIVRIDDVTRDPRYGRNAPYHGMPPGHLPVKSYLAVPVRNRAGEVLGGLFFGHSTPGMFRASHEQLAAGTATWASVALENARLYAAAHEANRLKDQFLATLSHELRTPLNAIVGYARMLRAGVLDGDRVRLAHEVIDRNATSLTQIVDDVLDVSRIISGKVRMNMQSTDMTSVVRDALATIAPDAEKKQIRVDAELGVDSATLDGDPERLQQVIWNLLSNAVKFTPADGTVNVCLSATADAVEIVISDTGAGITAELLPHVFERFRQGESVSGSRTGLGLGLAIVRSLVDAHGGTVTAESDGPGLGACFRLTLPRARQAPDLNAEPQPPTLTPGRTTRRLDDLRGLRIMVVDDDVDTLELGREILESAGATVRVVGSAAAALDALPQFRPHVMVSDLGMPHLDGFALIARVRDLPDPGLRDLAAVALSAYARSEDRARALRAGFDVHLSKPMDPHDLVSAITGLLADRVPRT